MSDDRASAQLAAIRERVRERRRLAASMAVAAVDAPEWYAITDHVAGDVPRLLAAVEAVLDVHQPHEVPVSKICPAHALGSLWRKSATLAQFRDEVRACPECQTEPELICGGCDTGDDSWPCDTRAAIESALTGKEGGNG